MATATNTPQPTATRTPGVGSCDRADVNCEGRVNETDALLVLLHFGRRHGSTRFDVNGDGRVNQDDLLIVLRCTDSHHRHHGHGFGHDGWGEGDD